MLRTHFKKQTQNLADMLKSRPELLTLGMVLVFVLLITLKITAFNYVILPRQTAEIFRDKFGYTLLIVLILSPLLMVFKTRKLVITLYVLQTIYILFNISYYHYFRTYFNYLELAPIFKEGLAAVSHLSAPLTTDMLVAFIDLPIFVYFVMNYTKIRRLLKKVYLVVILIMAVCCGMLTIIEIDRYHRVSSILQDIQGFFGESKIVESYGTIANAVSKIYEHKDFGLMIRSLKYGAEISGQEANKVRPNFVIIQVESMDANVIFQTHNGKYIAPFLHDLSYKSVFYPYVLSYHKGGGTSDVEFSILNSLQPLDDYPAIKLPNYTYPNSLVRTLLVDGYNPYAYHNNVGAFFNRDVAFPRMGFKRFLDIKAMDLEDIGWGAPDYDVFNYEIDMLKKMRKPFFTYTITMTSHKPFTNAAHYYKNEAYDDVADKKTGNYFNSITYVDQSIRSFVESINRSYPNTYIIIVGDHAPDISTEEYQQASYMSGEQYFEFVPLFIITPDHQIRIENKEVASFLDLAPTILNASGIAYTYKSDGVDLLDEKRLSPTIPLGDSSYNREVLFQRIKSEPRL
jgi:phosphoglycerol transferase MdoB-like AlkP superfamily enzyme